MGCKIQYKITRAGIEQNRRGLLSMLKSISKRFQLCLVVIVCLFIPGLSAYLHYNNLMEIDFLSSSNFENLDPETALWAEQQDPSMACGLDRLSTLFPPEENTSNRVDSIPSQESTRSKNTPVLRC